MRMKPLILLLAITSLATPAIAEDEIVLAGREDVRVFVAETAARHQLSVEELAAVLADARVIARILEAMNTPAESKPWRDYRPIFLTQTRIDQGIEFWDRHADLLARASSEYGVPAEIIVAILGVETRYGRHTGNYRVLDALATLAFEYPPRADFFRRELEHFLLLAREEQLDPLAATGSYAGAIGQAQFMPSSYRNYAVDFDGDGRRDLAGSAADAVGSIANYFRRHGWRTGEPVAVPARVSGEVYQGLITPGTKPEIPLSAFADYGVESTEALDPQTLSMLLMFEAQDGPEYWLGLNNFYVITRYNRSSLYAMAVYQLSCAILEQRGLRQARK